MHSGTRNLHVHRVTAIMVMVMVMEILFHLGRPLAMRLLYKAPRTAQIQVTVGPVKEGGGEEKHIYNNSK